jgi:hypothetical protein
VKNYKEKGIPGSSQSLLLNTPKALQCGKRMKYKLLNTEVKVLSDPIQASFLASAFNVAQKRNHAVLGFSCCIFFLNQLKYFLVLKSP